MIESYENISILREKKGNLYKHNIWFNWFVFILIAVASYMVFLVGQECQLFLTGSTSFFMCVSCFVRMAEGSLEERSLEILDIPDDLDDDLLSLYFDNKRRSGGGNLVSLEKHGNHALVVFEDAESKKITFNRLKIHYI